MIYKKVEIDRRALVAIMSMLGITLAGILYSNHKSPESLLIGNDAAEFGGETGAPKGTQLRSAEPRNTPARHNQDVDSAPRADVSDSGTPRRIVWDQGPVAFMKSVRAYGTPPIAIKRISASHLLPAAYEKLDAFNPGHKVLSPAAAIGLTEILAKHYRVLESASSEFDAFQKSSIDRAIERGDWLEVSVGSPSRIAPTNEFDRSSIEGSVRWLESKYGRKHKDFDYVIMGHNKSSKLSFLIYWNRDNSPEFYDLKSNLGQIQSQRDTAVRAFFERL